ncbi:MAG: UDP-N-acetylglucosamine 2-epimerase (hydrolyzing) [Robiginitomaculum sp.]|nr:MAG: UDP-N-acetylglucosamine 2-epimerase (hydrolyzing) [Robiginitomaculum sp.]
MTKRIAFLTGTRADFGKIKSLINILEDDSQFDVHIFVTGMHMNPKFGLTVDEVIKCKFSNIFQFINHRDVDRMDHILAKTVAGFSDYVASIKPDMIVIHGDRPEALAGAIVGSFNNIYVAHIEGGELSGTIDDSIRHAVSKLSHIHFVANESAKSRLLQLGEGEATVFIIGSPDLDLMDPKNLPSLGAAKQRYDIPFDEFSISMFHPVTTEHHDMEKHAVNYVEALKASGQNYVVIYPNNDLGSEFILSQIERLRGLERFRIFPSLRIDHFLTLLRYSKFIIGNSSAGIREAPFYNVPTIDVGTRQQNRSSGSSVKKSSYQPDDILSAIDEVSDWKLSLHEDEKMHFGVGGSDKKFYSVLKKEKLFELEKQKQFQEFGL